MQALVVDDSKAMRMILGKILREIGFTISEAKDGRAGLEQLAASGAVDLVMVDWNMPEMNGLEFVRIVRTVPGFEHMPLIMVTTETEMSQVVKALEAGASEYIMKPFTKDAIIEKLELLGIPASHP